MFKDGAIQFKNETELVDEAKSETFLWNILIVDDEPSVHDVTKLALSSFEFEQRKCSFIGAYSASEAKKIIKDTPNIALAFIDVVMETDDAGLNLVNYIRNEIHNKVIRIILRTGQPGQAPEEKVIHDYDINDYKSKNELTTQKLYTSMLTGLRTYRDMIALEKNRQGLKKIIASTSSIEKMPSLEKFLSALLEQLVALLHLGNNESNEDVSSFIAAVKEDEYVHLVGGGIYKEIKKDDILKISTNEIRPLMDEAIKNENEVNKDGHYILYSPSFLEYSGCVLYIKVDKELKDMDKDLIKLFFDNAKTAYENTMLTQELDASQREIIFTISEIAEQRSNETGQHVKRVAMYSRLLAEAIGLSKDDTEIIFAASPMHDIGKIAIPDEVLKKPGRLTDDEMTIMRNHAQIGHDVLKSSKRKILQMSAIIARDHHEKYDGSGYPRGLKGEEIHLYARIVSIADVFDALGSSRVYKKRWEMDKVLELLQEEKGKHFDPKLIDLFFENLDKVMEIHNTYKDFE